VTPEDVVDVLTKAAAFDQRTVGRADVLAWHEVIGRLDRDDALAAVTRHYTESRDRVMPADVVRLARVVREDRRRLEARSEALALPSRYEDDVTRDIRIKEGVAQCRDVLAAIMARLQAKREAIPAAGTYVAATQMAEGYEPPSGSLDLDAS
jgi:hypothetical protein